MIAWCAAVALGLAGCGGAPSVIVGLGDYSGCCACLSTEACLGPDNDNESCAELEEATRDVDCEVSVCESECAGIEVEVVGG